MSEEISPTSEHLFVVKTTSETNNVQTTGSYTTSSSSQVYFQCAVVFVGLFGAAANALIVYAMIASKQHRKQPLIFNQNVFDLCSCLLIVIIYILKLCDIYLTGTLGYWLCMIVLSENILWCAVSGSLINLMSITVERYLKVVHATWSKKVIRKWMEISAAAFAWIGSTAYNMAVGFSTSAVVDGVCLGYVIWKSRVAALAYGIWTFVSFFVLVLFFFVFCYWRILVVIRRQAHVMASHGKPGSSTQQKQSHRIQANVVKTMIIVSAFYLLTWGPNNIYYLILNVGHDVTLLDTEHYAIVFFGFAYISVNPFIYGTSFIYGTKFDPVRKVLARLIPCKKTQQQQSADENIEVGERRIAQHVAAPRNF